MQVLLRVMLLELEALDKERASVARRLNDAYAITKELPNEIFLNILSFLCPPGALSIGDRTRTSLRPKRRKEHPTADIRRVTQVCSMWRTVALASPSLWSSLNFNEEALPWLKELLRRCEPTPIHLAVALSGYDFWHPLTLIGMTDKFEMIQTSSPNIGSISVVYNDNETSSLVATIKEIISQKCTSATRLSFRKWPYPIPFKIDGELLPSLDNHRIRQLDVNGYHPDLTLSCFRQLASLSVSSLSGVTANDWLRALVGLPELEHLRLEDAISGKGKGKSVQVPCLRTLALIGEFDDGIGDILWAIGATKKYSLLLHCTIGENTDIEQLLHGLEKWFTIWNIDLHTNVSHRRVEFMASHIRFRLHNQIPGNELSDEWFRIFLNWRRLPNLHTLRKLQADIFRVFGPILRKTRTLSICPDRNDQGYICGPDFWQYFHGVGTLRFLSSARDGDLGDSTTSSFINALCNDFERSMTSSNPLPLLHILSFECETMVTNWPPLAQASSCTQSLERLSRVLGHRIVVELYSCNGMSRIRGLLERWLTCVHISKMKSPRF